MRACIMLARVNTLFTGQRERERKGERERERKIEYLFLKGMTGAMAPFSYLVVNINFRSRISLHSPRTSYFPDYAIAL